jgi:uncharacterized membrane protein
MGRYIFRAIPSPRRSLVKAVTWRCIGTLGTFLISYLVTRNAMWATSIAGVDAALKAVVYYAHERVWGHIRWGMR